MNILQIHNQYQIRGGEDVVVEREFELLMEHGHYVDSYIRSNHDIASVFQKIKVALQTHYSATELQALLAYMHKKSNGYDILHVHNFFPLLSPSVYQAGYEHKVPVVQTLHNYRTICPTSLLMFNGEVCERSLTESAYWAVPYKVYKNSFLATFILSHMIEYHKKKGTWLQKVSRFICLTEFSRQKFISAGFPAEKISVKPNFVIDPGPVNLSGRKERALFVGRLSQEKGIHILLEAWKQIDLPVDVIGEGDISGPAPDNVHFLGKCDKEQVQEMIRKCSFVVIPSLCYEGFPLVIAEAFSHGVPVICSNIGSMAEIVENQVTGLLFTAGDCEDLVEKVQILSGNLQLQKYMSTNARDKYLQEYTPEKNHQTLRKIYQQAIEETN